MVVYSGWGNQMGWTAEVYFIPVYTILNFWTLFLLPYVGYVIEITLV